LNARQRLQSLDVGENLEVAIAFLLAHDELLKAIGCSSLGEGEGEGEGEDELVTFKILIYGSN